MQILNKEIKTTWLIGGAVVAAAVFIVVIAYATKSSGMPAGPGGMRKRGSGNTVSVDTRILKTTTLHGYVSTNGEIESQNSVSVFPDMGGKVISTNVMLGSVVKKGDVIAYVDPSEPGTSYRQSPVYAPISGSIISTPLKNGTKVNTSTAIAIIGDINNLQVTANVPERYVAVLKTGLKAEVSVEAYPGVKFMATVSRVSPVVDSTSRTKQVILTFDKHDERVNAGMFAKVILFTEDYEGAVVMPSDAIVENSDKFYVYVVNQDSTVTKRLVTKGQSVDGLTQILTGLKEDEVAVIQGQTSLADGSKVLDISGNVKASESSEPDKNVSPENGFQKDKPGMDKPGQERSGKGKPGKPGKEKAEKPEA